MSTISDISGLGTFDCSLGLICVIFYFHRYDVFNSGMLPGCCKTMDIFTVTDK
jgi:hypothetical protein